MVIQENELNLCKNSGNLLPLSEGLFPLFLLFPQLHVMAALLECVAKRMEILCPHNSQSRSPSDPQEGSHSSSHLHPSSMLWKLSSKQAWPRGLVSFCHPSSHHWQGKSSTPGVAGQEYYEYYALVAPFPLAHKMKCHSGKDKSRRPVATILPLPRVPCRMKVLFCEDLPAFSTLSNGVVV